MSGKVFRNKSIVRKIHKKLGKPEKIIETRIPTYLESREKGLLDEESLGGQNKTKVREKSQKTIKGKIIGIRNPTDLKRQE